MLKPLGGIVLLLFLLQVAYAQQKVYLGDDILVQIKLIDENNRPVLNANVKAYSDFFSLNLYDDGLHSDDKADDGVYGNWIGASSLGIHTINIESQKDNYRYSSQSTVEVVEKKQLIDFSAIAGKVTLLRPYIGYFAPVIAAIIGLAVGLRLLSSKKKGETEVSEKIKDLEERKKDTEELIEQTKQEYFDTKIDEETFKERVDKYQQKIMEIDLKLKKIKKMIV